MSPNITPQFLCLQYGNKAYFVRFWEFKQGTVELEKIDKYDFSFYGTMYPNSSLPFSA